jgi:hypothetical protein
MSRRLKRERAFFYCAIAVNNFSFFGGRGGVNECLLWLSFAQQQSKIEKVQAFFSTSTFFFLYQGCHIFLGTKYQNREELLKDHKIYQMAKNYFQWP